MNIILKDVDDFFNGKNRFCRSSDYECFLIRKSYCGFVFGYDSLFINKDIGIGIKFETVRKGEMSLTLMKKKHNKK